jgi:hypothetical protein
LEAQASELREIALRVDRGYPYWEREGFEGAVDACGEWLNWRSLAESLTRDIIIGHDVDVRVPLEAQRAYDKAAESGMFTRFDLGYTLDILDEENAAITGCYLFGVQDFPHFGACLFLVASWSC